jgi:RNA polymerase sigma factor (sigma-70 family)
MIERRNRGLSPVGSEEEAIGLGRLVGTRSPLPPDPAVDRDDVCQEAAIQALLGFRSYREGAGTTRAAWVYRQAVWGALKVIARGDTRGRKVMERKKPMRERPHRFSEMDPGWEPTCRVSEETIASAWVRAVVNTLPVEIRQVFVMAVFGEMSHREIGVALGWPKTRVYRRYQEAKSKLREVCP